MSSLRINFVPNDPPKGKIQQVRKEPFAQLPPNYVRPSTLAINSNSISGISISNTSSGGVDLICQTGTPLTETINNNSFNVEKIARAHWRHVKALETITANK